MQFVKMHGLDNDFVVVDCFEQSPPADPARLAREVTPRYRGIGGDGLLLIRPARAAGPGTEPADAVMEIYNADGSRAQVCGNGLRCVAKYLVESGRVARTTVHVQTDAGRRTAWCQYDGTRVTSVRMDMGVPNLATKAIPCTLPVEQVVDEPVQIDGETFVLTCVSMGNPHAIWFVTGQEALRLAEVGPLLECAPCFPERTNVHAVRVDSPDRLTIRIWERGTGLTRACGTGAAAACVAGAVTGRSHRAVTVTLPGGDLQVEWAGDDHIYLTGPAEESFRGVWPPPAR